MAEARLHNTNENAREIKTREIKTPLEGGKRDAKWVAMGTESIRKSHVFNCKLDRIDFCSNMLLSCRL